MTVVAFPRSRGNDPKGIVAHVNWFPELRKEKDRETKSAVNTKAELAFPLPFERPKYPGFLMGQLIDLFARFESSLWL
jgi:hypothetical protein